MSSWILGFDDVTELYSLVDPDPYHDAWFIWGRDVDDSAPSDGEALVWSAAHDQWEPGTASGGAPAAHAATHAAAGSDPVTPSAIGADPAGTAAAAISGHTSAYDHTHIPTHDQKAALSGTSGSPSVSNRYVTDDDSRNTNSRVPVGHKSTHQPGGADAMAVDAAAGTGSLRTLGTSATSACAGNDSRLSDARTPTSHAASHAYGGGDEVIPYRMVVPLTNKTGSASVAGHLVQIHPTLDGCFVDAVAHPESTPENHSGIVVGVVLDAGVADGSSCRVVVAGLALVYCECGTRGQVLTAHESVNAHGAGENYSATSPCYAQGLGIIRDNVSPGGGLTWCILQVQHDINILITAPT